MLYTNVEDVLRCNPDVENKYALAAAIARRAHRLQERNRNRLDDLSAANFITLALEDLENDRLEILRPRASTPAEAEAADVARRLVPPGV